MTNLANYHQAYLLSLGIPKSATPLLWIAGPLCGMIVQPILGAVSDNFRPQPGFGRRKPFILTGTLGTVASMIGLAWIGETVAAFEAIASKDLCQVIRLVFAFVWVYALNVSLQPLQGGIRTMLFESCSRQQQVQVASWYSIIIAIGNVCGYFLGSMSLHKLGIPLISRMTQFQALCTIISILLLATTIITCFCANEGIPAVSEDRNAGLEEVFSVSSNRGSVITRAVRENLKCLRSLPGYIIHVFQIQFFTWLGWFPVIYYQTSCVLPKLLSLYLVLTTNLKYLADLYISLSNAEKVETNESLRTDATRKASFAALAFAVVALTTAVFLAFLVSRTSMRPRHIQSHAPDHGTLLVTLWLFGHLLFVLAMLATIYANTVAQGTVLIATIGISWTLTAWVPFAIIGKEVRRSRQAGTLTSLHNAAISAPQVLAAIMCALLFFTARSMGRREDTVWAMWMAGCAAIMAAWKTWQLRTLLAIRGKI